MNIDTKDFVELMCSKAVTYVLEADGKSVLSEDDGVHNLLCAYDCASSCVKSPIESVMFSLLCNVSTGYGYLTPEFEGEFKFGFIGGEIKPQFKIGNYFADFAISLYGGDTVVIECDGHDFHEKTKEQVARDKKRDRFIKGQGYDVYRFSGSEIISSPFSVIEEVEGIVQKLVQAAVDKEMANA